MAKGVASNSAAIALLKWRANHYGSGNFELNNVKVICDIVILYSSRMNMDLTSLNA